MTRRIEWTVVALLSAAYVIVCVQVGAISYGDYPNHLARAVVLADLMFEHGERFGAVFQFHFMPIPYLLGDLMLAGAVKLLGVAAATAIWTTLNLLAMPLAVLFYLRVTGTALHTRALFAIVSLYLSTDWFFLKGFLNFHLAVAMVLFALALVQSLRKRWSPAVFSAYSVVVALGYLMHLAFVVFLAGAIGVTALLQLWTRATTLRREIVLFIPICLIAAWHVLSAAVFPDVAEVVSHQMIWPSIASKMRHLDWDLIRLQEPIDLLIATGFAACVIFTVMRQKGRQPLTSPGAIEQLLLAAAFVALYFVLPSRYGKVSYIDIRALALAGPFVAFALLMLVDSAWQGQDRMRGFLTTAFSLLALGNLIYLGNGLAVQQDWLTRYRALTAPVPAGASVLSINTRGMQDQMDRFHHAAALAVVVDRGAFMPYLFSGDQRHPMKYFRYIDRGYAPRFDWYTIPEPADVDWRTIACRYDYLLLTEPYAPQRIGVVTTVAAQNASGALLKISRQQCPGTLPTQD